MKFAELKAFMVDLQEEYDASCSLVSRDRLALKIIDVEDRIAEIEKRVLMKG